MKSFHKWLLKNNKISFLKNKYWNDFDYRNKTEIVGYMIEYIRSIMSELEKMEMETLEHYSLTNHCSKYWHAYGELKHILLNGKKDIYKELSEIITELDNAF